MSEPRPRSPRRWGLIIPWALAGLIVLGWCGYWFALQAAVTQALTEWSTTQEQATGRPTYATARVTGFPLRVQVRLEDVGLIDPRGAWQATTAVALVAVNPTNPQHILIAAPEPVTYSLRGGPERVLTADQLEASVRQENGRLARFSVVGAQVRAAPPGADPEAGLRFANLAVHVRPDARTAGDWQVALQGAGVRLASPVRGFEDLGQELASVTLGVVVTKAEALADAEAADPLALWRQAGGAARIEAAEIAWGPARASGQGLVQLDEDRRLQGRIDLQMEDARALLQAVSGGGDNPLTAMLAQALDISTLTFVAQGGALTWEAQTPLGDVAPQPVRSLGPVY